MAKSHWILIWVLWPVTNSLCFARRAPCAPAARVKEHQPDLFIAHLLGAFWVRFGKRLPPRSNSRL